MASYDDLAFHGGARGNRAQYLCPRCASRFEASVHPSSSSGNVECPTCGGSTNVRAPAPQPASSAVSSSAASDRPAGSAFEALQSLFQNLQLFSPSFVGDDASNANGNSNLQQLIDAQRGVDVEALMERMLHDSEHNAHATSDKFIKSLVPAPLDARDFVQVYIEIPEIKRDLFVTGADFGSSLVEKHTLDDEKSQTHLSAPLIASEPLTGKAATNTSEFKDKIVLFSRGAVTFVDKVRLAQNAGAKGCVIMQTDEVWPYVMTDTAKLGKDLLIPSVMVSKRDGEALQQMLRIQKGQNSQLHMKSRGRKLACPICREDYQISSSVVKLPCLHFFCHECVLPWLKKRNTCPLCRYNLPAEDSSDQRKAQTLANQALLESTMFT